MRKKPHFALLGSVLLVMVASLAGLYIMITGTQQGQDSRSQASRALDGKQLWVQESNGGNGGGVLADFKEQFTTPEKWRRAQKYIDVYQFHDHIFQGRNAVDDAFIKDHIVPTLQRAGIKIAINVKGANWSQCDDRAKIMEQEAVIIDRIHAAGGKVSYLMMQSTLSKTEGGNSEVLNQCQPYPDNKRIEDIVRYVKFMKQRYPDIQVGLSDADPTKGLDYRTSLLNLKTALGKENLTLDFIFFDNATVYFVEKGSTAASMKQVEAFVKNQLGWRFGLVYTGLKGGMKSNADYHDVLMKGFNTYQQGGGSPDNFMVTSWMEYPTQHLPDVPAAGDHSMMSVAWEVGRLVHPSLVGEGDSPQAPMPAQPVELKSRFGRVQDTGAATGWVYNDKDKGQILTVHFYVDGPESQGRYLGQVVANEDRPLVGRHGFRFQLPSDLKDGKAHSLFVLVETPQGRQALNNSPFSFTWR